MSKNFTELSAKDMNEVNGGGAIATVIAATGVALVVLSRRIPF